MSVHPWGKGKPDFTLEADTITRKGLVLEYEETTKIFARSYISTNEWATSAYPGVGAALAPGQSDHLIDFSTGSALPYTVPQGYVLSVKYYSFTGAGIMIFTQYLDNMVVQNAFLRGLEIYYEQEIFAVGTDLIDPTGASSHTYDVTITNPSQDSLCGIYAAVGILKAVSTEPLTTKTVKCKFCDTTAEVDYNTREWTCPNGHKNIYMVLGDRR